MSKESLRKSENLTIFRAISGLKELFSLRLRSGKTKFAAHVAEFDFSGRSAEGVEPTMRSLALRFFYGKD